MNCRLIVEQDTKRADQFLSAALPDMSRNAAQRLLEEGRVTRAGQPLKKSDLLHTGDMLDVDLPEAEPAEALPEAIPLDVCYEDDDVIVINKPVGMVVHPAPGHQSGTLVNALLYHCGSSLSGIGGQMRPGIVHRIDRNTSGLIIAAKNDFAHKALAAQLEDHSLFREYDALVLGRLKEESGTIDAPIGRSSRDRKKMAVVRNGGRHAVTHFETLAVYPGATHVSCRLETGRTHQIRVHFASIGHPVLGDPVYGKPYPGLAGQCLHARRLSFSHPRGGRELTVECPLPDYFAALLQKLGRMAGI